MFFTKGSLLDVQQEHVENRSKLQFTSELNLDEGSWAYLNPVTDERVMVYWFDKEDETFLVNTAELDGPMFVNTAHPVVLKNLGDKSAVVDYLDLNTVIETYKGA
mgnify:FL=1